MEAKDTVMSPKEIEKIVSQIIGEKLDNYTCIIVERTAQAQAELTWPIAFEAGIVQGKIARKKLEIPEPVTNWREAIARRICTLNPHVKSWEELSESAKQAWLGEADFFDAFIKAALPELTKEAGHRKVSGMPPVLTEEEIRGELGEIQPEGFNWTDITGAEMIKFKAIAQAQRDADVKWMKE